MTPGPNARCASRHAEDLASGRTVAPGESFYLSAAEQGDPHNKRLIDEGKVLITASNEGELTGDALERRAKQLKIEGRSEMNADQLRAAVAEAEREKGGEGQ